MARYGNCRVNSRKSVMKNRDDILESISRMENENKPKFNHFLKIQKGYLRKIDVKLNKGDYTQKSISKRKNMDLKKLKTIVLAYINNKKLHTNIITKEEISKKYNVKQHLVEQIFHQLNLEGLLSQRHSNFAHDTNRNPMFPMPESGWAEDIYYINEKTIDDVK